MKLTLTYQKKTVSSLTTGVTTKVEIDTNYSNEV